MTKSQNTKNEQLTEQWKKGELPEGWYYCKINNNIYILSTWKGIKNYIQLKNKEGEVFIREMDDCEVLSAVPSYDELQSMNEAVNQAMAANIKLVEQINRLKDLLKACRLSINGYPPYESGSEILRLTYRIDEVLK